ncbi:hypothetical protein ACLKA7_006939 [Drosophila subpalustris]
MLCENFRFLAFTVWAVQFDAHRSVGFIQTGACRKIEKIYFFHRKQLVVCIERELIFVKMSENNNQQAKKKRTSRSMKAGVSFPVSRIDRKLRERRYAKRFGEQASVYMTAVIEYLVAEVVECAGFEAQEEKKARITPRHLQLAVYKDMELHELLSKITIARGGVYPHIQTVLLPKKATIPIPTPVPIPTPTPTPTSILTPTPTSTPTPEMNEDQPTDN